MKYPIDTIGLVGDGQPPRHRIRVKAGAWAGRHAWRVEVMRDGLIHDMFLGQYLNEVLEAVQREYPDVQFDPEEE